MLSIRRVSLRFALAALALVLAACATPEKRIDFDTTGAFTSTSAFGPASPMGLVLLPTEVTAFTRFENLTPEDLAAIPKPKLIVVWEAIDPLTHLPLSKLPRVAFWVGPDQPVAAVAPGAYRILGVQGLNVDPNADHLVFKDLRGLDYTVEVKAGQISPPKQVTVGLRAFLDVSVVRDGRLGPRYFVDLEDKSNYELSFRSAQVRMAPLETTGLKALLERYPNVSPESLPELERASVKE